MTGKMKLYGMNQAVDRLTPATEPNAVRCRLEWMQPGTAVAIIATAGLFMGLVDWLLAKPSQNSGLLLATSILTTMGSAAVLALVLMPMIHCARLILGDRKNQRAWLGAILFFGGALIFGGLIPPLLALPGIEEAKRLPLALALIGVSLLLLSLAVLFAIRHIIWPKTSPCSRRTWVASLFFLGLGLAWQYADARFLVGGYPNAHWLAFLAATASYSLFVLGIFTNLEDRVPHHAGRLITLALVLVATAVGLHSWLRGQPIIHVLRESLLRPSFTVSRKVLPEMETLFLNALVPIAPLDLVNADDLVVAAMRQTNETERISALLAADRNQWNVVIITADTLRFDEVDWARESQGRESLTPALAKLASQSIILNNAYTPYPTSAYAYSSMLTGYYPRFTPARRPFDPKGKYFNGKLLTELLRESGRATWAITAFNESGIRDDAAFGHTRPGFDIVNPLHNKEVLDASAVTRSALELINKATRDKPFFLWAHYMDAHAVYRQHENPRFQFGNSPRDLYRGEIAYLDSQLKPLIKRLARDDLADRTLIVFVSDHGESFGEHETSFHNSNLHREQIRVPAFFHIPHVRAGTRSPAFSLVDMTPTILSLLGIEDPDVRQGRNWANLLLGLEKEELWTDFNYSERFPRDPLPGREAERTLTYAGGKLIKFAGENSARHYDLSSDPLELHNDFDLANTAQKQQLSFMVALDRYLDAFMGPVVNRDTKFIKELRHSLSDLENTTPQDDLHAVFSMAKIMFDRQHKYIDHWDDVLDAQTKKRLHDDLAALAASEFQPPAVRLASIEFLLSLPHKELTVFMEAGLKSPNKVVQQESALWLAKRGNHKGITILTDSLGAPGTEWNLRVAPHLVDVQKTGLAHWLMPSLASDRSDAVTDALGALSALHYHDLDLVLREHLSAPALGMKLPRSQIALAKAAAQMTGRHSLALLARIAHSVVPEARRTCRQALSLRLSKQAVQKRLQAASQEILADESFRERRYQEAHARITEAIKITNNLGVRDSFLAIKSARLEIRLGQAEKAQATLSKILDSKRNTRPWVRAYARSLAKVSGQDVKRHIQLDAYKLTVQINPSATHLPTRQLAFFAREVEITNAGDLHLAGGVSPWGKRLTWLFRNAKTGAYLSSGNDRRLLSRFFPASGLGVGETIKIVTIGRMPNPPGLWLPVLVLMREPWFSTDHEVILELPGVQI